MEEHYCTNCGAVLEEQPGFDPEEGLWTCTECGKHLFGDDFPVRSDFPDVVWYCDECGAVLNVQPGFECSSDDVWKCHKCGHENRISDDEIYSSEDEWKRHKCGHENRIYDDDVYSSNNSRPVDDDNGEEGSSWLDDDEGDVDDDEDSVFLLGAIGIAAALKQFFDAQAEKRASERAAEAEREAAAERARETRAAIHWKQARALLFNHKRIAVGYGSDALVQMSPSEVRDKLSEMAFKRVSLVPLNDLRADKICLDGRVESVLIGSADCFAPEDEFPYDLPIAIRYHTKALVSVGMPSGKMVRKNFQEISRHFAGRGFTNVCTQALGDLKLGVVKKPGDVQSVTIDGNGDFKKGDMFYYDTEVIIYYHSFIGEK